MCIWNWPLQNLNSSLKNQKLELFLWNLIVKYWSDRVKFLIYTAFKAFRTSHQLLSLVVVYRSNHSATATWPVEDQRVTRCLCLPLCLSVGFSPYDHKSMITWNPHTTTATCSCANTSSPNISKRAVGLRLKDRLVTESCWKVMFLHLSVILFTGGTDPPSEKGSDTPLHHPTRRDGHCSLLLECILVSHTFGRTTWLCNDLKRWLNVESIPYWLPVSSHCWDNI